MVCKIVGSDIHFLWFTLFSNEVAIVYAHCIGPVKQDFLSVKWSLLTYLSI